MPEQVKILQRRLLALNQRVLENAEHRWPACTGFSGRQSPDYANDETPIVHSRFTCYS